MFRTMVEWIKDWAPILATIGTLMGVIITVGGASRTYQHGLIEKRKDHQRELIGELIANTQQWVSLLDIAYTATAKMSTNDMMEFADTDSGNLLNELSKATQVSLIKCLCEVNDDRIRPHVGELEVQRRLLTDGDDVAPMFNPKRRDDERFDALLVMLGRLRKMKDTCDRIQIAAIEALPVEIETAPRAGYRFRRWLRESMFAV